MPTIWLIGTCGAEAGHAAAMVPSLMPGAALFAFESPASAVACRAQSADLVLVDQRRPREFSRNEVAALIESQPLARFVVSLGPWCASASRSEQLWPESITVPHWAAEPRLRREAAVLAGRRQGPPLTAGRDELLLTESETGPASGRAGFVAVRSPDRALAAALRDAVLAAAGTIVEPAALTRGAVLLWDVDPLEAARLREVSRARCAFPACRIVALTALPLPSVTAVLRAAGADLVLPKPVLQSQIAAAIAVSPDATDRSLSPHVIQFDGDPGR